jgi:hypothetical protein
MHQLYIHSHIPAVASFSKTCQQKHSTRCLLIVISGFQGWTDSLNEIPICSFESITHFISMVSSKVFFLPFALTANLWNVRNGSVDSGSESRIENQKAEKSVVITGIYGICCVVAN